MKRTYIVVENAGYVRECDIRSFTNYGKAARYMERLYSDDERRELHVLICKADENGENRSYEI